MQLDSAYKVWITELKQKVKSAQIKAALTVNRELILFYWDLGQAISDKLQLSQWGDKVLESVSKDLQMAFPDMRGFSVSNLKTCKLFYEYFGSQLVNQNQVIDNELVVVLRQLVIQLPWGHIKIIITKIKDQKESLFYIQKVRENNWSRDTLALQIKSDLYRRSGRAISNFQDTLPEAMSNYLAQQVLKDPYVFDFLQLSESFRERDIENQLVVHIRNFLLELGKGFAFVGQQQHFEIGGKDYYIDLLFYHIKLKCYVIIELKNTSFMPEYTGKLNFYLSAVDSLIKEADDKPTIGILLCRDKNSIEAEFALRDIHKPIGVSEFELTNVLPENLKSSLPTIEEIEQEFLSKID